MSILMHLTQRAQSWSVLIALSAMPLFGAARADDTLPKVGNPTAVLPTPEHLIQHANQFYSSIKTMETEQEGTQKIRETITESRTLSRWRVPDRYFTILLTGPSAGFALSRSWTQLADREKAGQPIKVTPAEPDTFRWRKEAPTWDSGPATRAMESPEGTLRVTEEQRQRQDTYHLHVTYPGTITIGIARVELTKPTRPLTKLVSSQSMPIVTADWWFRKENGEIIEQMIFGIGTIQTFRGKPDSGRLYSSHTILVRELINTALPDTAFEIPG